MSLMRVPVTSDMREPALDYLKWRALGVPAATLLLVAIGEYRAYMRHTCLVSGITSCFYL